ncbi:hypothetical protein [Marinobacter sp. LV10R510-11A]|uniref:hypothetical protein n=1 Tax=Marinobacter sp. LV10R510-11A TaxID=1415568 RepID=UPI000BB72438|nr:hypothetical protein [Marinobacter sp. LV10R510-11A]
MKFTGPKNKKRAVNQPFLRTRARCARPLNQKAPKPGLFVARTRRKLTGIPLPADRHLARQNPTTKKDAGLQYPPEYRDAERAGQGLIKKAAWIVHA